MAIPINRESDPRWDILRDYVFERMVDMGLGHWWLSIEQTPPRAQLSCECGGVVNAEASIHANSVAISLSFGDNFFMQSPSFQRHVVIHELLHALDKPSDALIDVLHDRGCVAENAWWLWCDAYNQARERMIDTVASIMAKQFPLPDLSPADASLPVE